ncbi:hypothetical protein PV761_17755 [Arthrobacter sp. CC3]|uniref:hypothetical protein n=1 Tax=Arthrobacter sp. CC3 TaxID=3029185 RepID=UPI0032635CB0
MSELAYRIKDHAGTTRRRAAWGGERSVPAETATLVSPAAAAQALTGPASTGPALTGPASAGAASSASASAMLVSGVRAIPSTTHPNEAGHLRPAVKVPVALSLRGLGAVSGLVSVHITINPVVHVAAALQVGQVPVPGSLSFSFISVGTACVLPTLTLKGTTFTAAFKYEVAAGSTELDFAIDGYGRHGRNSDRSDFEVTAEVSVHDHGRQSPTVLAVSSIIRL